MNLSNPARGILQKVPGLNGALDKILARLNALWDVEHNADGTHRYITERGRAVAMGEWIDIPFAAANFTGGGSMTWTVAITDQQDLSYTLIGTTCVLLFQIDTTTVGGGGSGALRVALPSTLVPARKAASTFAYSDNTTPGIGYAYIEQGGRHLNLYTDFAGTNWNVLGTDATYVQGQIIFEIEP